jgi:hypothetical protein
MERGRRSVNPHNVSKRKARIGCFVADKHFPGALDRDRKTFLELLQRSCGLLESRIASNVLVGYDTTLNRPTPKNTSTPDIRPNISPAGSSGPPTYRASIGRRISIWRLGGCSGDMTLSAESMARKHRDGSAGRQADRIIRALLARGTQYQPAITAAIRDLRIVPMSIGDVSATVQVPTGPSKRNSARKTHRINRHGRHPSHCFSSDVCESRSNIPAPNMPPFGSMRTRRNGFREPSPNQHLREITRTFQATLHEWLRELSRLTVAAGP